MKLLIILFTSCVYASVFNGSVSSRLRVEENKDQREQYKVNFNFKHEFGEESCLSINAQILTGDSYGSTNNDFDDDFELNLSKLYLDVKCFIDKTIQVGAIPNESLHGLDLDKNGWIDGMKVTIDMKTIIDQFSITYGSVNPDSSPNIFERISEEQTQFIRALIKKELNSKLKTALALTDFNNELIFQGILEVSTQDIVPFVDEIKIYTGYSAGKNIHKGIDFSKKIGKYSLKYGYYTVEDAIYPTSSFVAREDSIYISLSRTFKERIKVTARARTGKSNTRIDFQVEYIF